MTDDDEWQKNLGELDAEFRDNLEVILEEMAHLRIEIKALKFMKSKLYLWSAVGKMHVKFPTYEKRSRQTRKGSLIR